MNIKLKNRQVSKNAIDFSLHNTIQTEYSLCRSKFAQREIAVSGFTGTHIIMKLSNLHITGFHGLLLHVGVIGLSNQTLLMILKPY